MMREALGAVALGALLTGGAGVQQASAQDEGELNIYSARHYQTDEQLYAGFEERTGITINRIEADSDVLMQRIENEGANTPADVLITVDAGRLWRAEEAGLFASIESDVLKERLPERLRHPDGKWFGFSQRLRVIYYDASRWDEPPVTTYEGLADPALEGEVCIRSSSNIYNQSLLASMIEHHGEEEAEAWAAGVVNNFARDPQGGDTDQIRGVAAGECGVAVANHYYYLRLIDNEPETVESVSLVLPNQGGASGEGRGVHANISGAGVVENGPNRENAVAFLEYLSSDFAQRYFADGNNEFPAVEGVEAGESAADLGEFKIDAVNVSVYGENQPLAQMIFDRVGWR